MNTARFNGILRDLAILIGVMTVCVCVALALSRANNDNNPFAASLFILSVVVISRYTSGYVYGIVASLLGVVCVNYMFTYPFFEFDFSQAGYPLTFTVMLTVSLIISALSTRLKKQERLKFEAEAEKTRANLLRGVSHDIRTPLASIMGASSAILNNPELSRDDALSLVKSINEDAMWLMRTTENLLSITRITSDGVVIKKAPEVVEEIALSAVAKFKRSHPDLPVRVTRPPEIVLAPMDAVLVQQVIINILENVAMHAEGATSIELKIETAGDRVWLRVTDDGAGIPDNELAHLFDGGLSARGDSRKIGKRSMGLGLCVCNSIIRAHQGDMSAQNNKPHGAQVSFWLPKEELKNGE